MKFVLLSDQKGLINGWKVPLYTVDCMAVLSKKRTKSNISNDFKEKNVP